MIKIEEIYYYLPNKPIDNNSLGLRNPSWDMNALYRKTGVVLDITLVMKRLLLI